MVHLICYFLFVCFASDILCRFDAVEMRCVISRSDGRMSSSSSILRLMMCARDTREMCTIRLELTRTHTAWRLTHAAHTIMCAKDSAQYQLPRWYVFHSSSIFGIFPAMYLFIPHTKNKKTKQNYKCEIKTRNWRCNQKLEEEKTEKEKEKRIFTMAYHSRTFSVVSSVCWSLCCTPRFRSVVASTRETEFQLSLLQRFCLSVVDMVWYAYVVQRDMIVWNFQNFVGRFSSELLVWCGVVWLFSRYLNSFASALRNKFDSIRCYITALVCFPFGAWLAALDAVT